MVYDAAAKEHRDVDITITYRDAGGIVTAVSGLEVKDHTRPLDVTHVEQLWAKLADMPAVTKRAIVSTSGFTDGAVSKAHAHDVGLWTLREWNPAEKLFAADMSAFTVPPERVLLDAGGEITFESPGSIGEQDVGDTNSRACSVRNSPRAPTRCLPSLGAVGIPGAMCGLRTLRGRSRPSCSRRRGSTRRFRGHRRRGWSCTTRPNFAVGTISPSKGMRTSLPAAMMCCADRRLSS